ncbi:uncharacterized protein F5147DRAFT_18090 [Suillus discolor]|uniref:Uncharacterized protein n=1 Tax=Suillus discolor TaxID=1912936 RepID=A0A9P7FF03_9AGAM|nr:uncharacterized protein F5147DRAFT_18090 [Suillus discolor]KAG2114171.1 hypothetical protein F5147DRAFT_18090 [Suillus discolor]
MASAIALLYLLLKSLLGFIIFTAYTNKLSRRSPQARHAIIKNLGISTTSNPQFIGFFLPKYLAQTQQSRICFIVCHPRFFQALHA